MAVVSAAAHARRAAPAEVADPLLVLLLNHDSDWGRSFRSRLMSWGVDVVIGPYAHGPSLPSAIVLDQATSGSDMVRQRLRQARALLPAAQIVVVTSAGESAGRAPVCAEDHDDFRDCLHAAGIGFVSGLDG
jgi:hypothetical protein